MTETKKTRNMSPKGFLNKAGKAKSAIGFIQAYRDYLVTGELASITSPIVAKIEAKEILPTPGLELITNAVFAHIVENDLRKAEKALENADKPSGTTKAILATVYNAKGEVMVRINEKGKEVDLSQGFDMYQEAEGWLDRRLFEGASDWHGEIVSLKIHTAMGPMTNIILRDDSIARIMKHKKGPIVHRKPQTTSKLGFGVKAKGDRFHFSKG